MSDASIFTSCIDDLAELYILSFENWNFSKKQLVLYHKLSYHNPSECTSIDEKKILLSLLNQIG